MSKNLYWRPLPKPEPEPDSLPYALQAMLNKRYEGFGGWHSGEPTGANKDTIPYLEGLRDAGVDGAQELIDAIRDHGAIELWIDE